MKYLALACALLLGSCARHKPSPAPHSEPIGVILPPGDTEFTRINSDNPAENGPSRPGVVVQPPRTILDKLTGRTPPPVYYPPGTPVVVKGKKNTLTVNHVAGDQSNNTAGKNAVAGTGATGGKSEGPVAGAGGTTTSIEKAKAPVTTGTGDATDQAGAGVASTIKGNNNAPVLTNTQPQAPDWKASLASAIASPVGKVAALLLLMSVGYGVYRLWPVLRRKSSPDTTV